MAHLRIKHGKPNTPFFMIALPRGWENLHSGTASSDGHNLPVVELHHPKSDEKLLVEINDFFAYRLKEIPNSISRLAYGITAAKLRTALERQYSNISDESIIEFLICKLLKKL